MTTTPATSDGCQPQQWDIGHRTLIVSADGKRVLAVLNGCDPLLLPPGSVLRLGDPLGELVVTRVGVIVDKDGGAVCIEAEPDPRRDGASVDPGRPAERPGHLRLVPSQAPRRSRVRPGNG